ncbi:Major facilitator superfamily permease [Streptomyces hygroscopicus subsp. limoneus]|nr:Major facilitator superfamily permease [Streptomyces hygroscopicus subsp. limoneus]
MTVVNSKTAVDPGAPTPPASPSRARRAGALTGVSLGYFMVLLDTTVLSVAEPDLAASLHTSMAGLQWATTGYTVVFAALLLSAGAAADRFGADRVFRTGAAVFALASLLSSLAPDLGALLVLRAVSGAAAAACVPASMALIARLYPQPAARARAISVWAAVSGAAVAAGPIAGGALVEAAGWRAVFLVNVPLGLLVLALTWGRAVRCPRGAHRVDWPAQAAAVVVLALLTDVLIAAGAGAWVHTAWSAAGLGAAVTVFALLERRSQAPVVNRTLLRSAPVRAGLMAGAVTNFALSGALFVLPLLLQRERHLSALETGLAFLPLTVPFAANPPLTGRIVARTGPRPPIVAGLALLTAGGTVLAGTVFAEGAYGWLAAGLLLTGFGISFILPALAAAVIGAAPPGTAGSVGGLLNAVRQTGATLGVALMGAAATAGTGWALLLSAGLCALAWPAFALTPGGTTR